MSIAKCCNESAIVSKPKLKIKFNSTLVRKWAASIDGKTMKKKRVLIRGSGFSDNGVWVKL